MIRKTVKVVGIIYIAYLALAMLVVMPALNFIPPWYVKQNYNRELQTELVIFNPFTLALEVRQAALPEPDGERFAGLHRAEVNLSLAGLWQPGWVFDAVSIEGLYVHVRQLAADQFNFSDLLPEASAEESTEEAGEIPGITIHDFNFHAQDLRYTQENREESFTTHYENLALRVTDLSTVIEEGKPYKLEATAGEGGSLLWSGDLSIPGAYSRGQLSLSGISLRPVWRFAEPWVNFDIKQALLDVEGRYSIDWKESLAYQVSEGALRIYDTRIDPKASGELPETAVELGALAVTGITIDGPAQHAKIEAVDIDGLAISGWSEGSRVSLAEMFAVDMGEPAAADQEDAEAGDPWTAEIASIGLLASVDWRSEFTDPPHLQVTPLEAQVQGLRWPFDGDTGVTVNLRINEQAEAGASGTLALASGDGRIEYQLKGLPLTWFNPNLPKELKAELTGGEVELAGKTALSGFVPARIGGTGAITGFSGKVEGEEDSLTSWETVQWQDLQVDLDQRSVALGKLSIIGYSGRLHIREDGSINTQKLWQEEVGEQAEQLAEDLSRDQPWTISLPVIQVAGSAVDFMDESLPIRFRTVVGDLDGEVLGLSTAPGAIAKVTMKGSVDGYAPVNLNGTAAPFNAPPDLDLSLTFDGVDMALLTPYSGTYAGRTIERGLLSLDLQYALQSGKLDGNNKVLIAQLRLGEKVDSDRALDLPLDLALALLTDMNGVIDLTVPVSGDIDNPEFSLGSVIAGAFMNLITKAVTAPFALLANLVGSDDEDLQRINFASGSAELMEAERARLDQLGSALAQRPNLTLVVSGRLHPTADRERLQGTLLEEQLLADGLDPKQLETRGPDWEEAIQERYAALGAAGKKNPEGAEPTVREQYEQVRATIEVPASALTQLIESRAIAVKSYLVNEAGMASDRAVIDAVNLEDKAHTFSGVELDVDA